MVAQNTEGDFMERQKVFFTADTHWGHENVIGFDKRPFNTVDEMDPASPAVRGERRRAAAASAPASASPEA